MLNSKLSIVFLIILVLGSVTWLGCGSDDSSRALTSAEKFDNSIIDLPDSLAGSQQARTGMVKADSGGGMEGIYSGIRHYIALVEMFKEFAKELMVNIAQSGMIESAVKGQEYDISDSSDPESPQRLVLEDDDSGIYEYKLSLYFTDSGTTPEMIVRFTIADSAAKGRILWEMTEEESDLTEVGITGVNITRQLDLTFDGTTSTKTLEVKLIQDLSELVTYAESAGTWASLTDAQKDALDLGQPSKVFCNASYDGSEFTIYGTSYHPGWATEATLNGDDSMWGTDRSMYMFKAKAIEGNTEGAKLYLALPLETTSDITNVWTEDSVGNIFTDMMLDQLNNYIAILHDGNDDPEDEYPGNAAAEQATADAIVTWITGSAPGDYVITKAELEAFISDPPSGSESFAAMYESISYMINPAFYDSTNGFLGTYDEMNDIFYNYTGTGMEAGTAPASFSVLNALDLSSINPYVPTEVVSATITVE